jgi:hypothetical protein
MREWQQRVNHEIDGFLATTAGDLMRYLDVVSKSRSLMNQRQRYIAEAGTDQGGYRDGDTFDWRWP